MRTERGHSDTVEKEDEREEVGSRKSDRDQDNDNDNDNENIISN